MQSQESERCRWTKRRRPGGRTGESRMTSPRGGLRWTEDVAGQGDVRRAGDCWTLGQIRSCKNGGERQCRQTMLEDALQAIQVVFSGRRLMEQGRCSKLVEVVMSSEVVDFKISRQRAARSTQHRASRARRCKSPSDGGRADGRWRCQLVGSRGGGSAGLVALPLNGCRVELAAAALLSPA